MKRPTKLGILFKIILLSIFTLMAIYFDLDYFKRAKLSSSILEISFILFFLILIIVNIKKYINILHDEKNNSRNKEDTNSSGRANYSSYRTNTEQRDYYYHDEQRNTSNARSSFNNGSKYFNGCNDYNSLKKKYKILSAKYHPDNTKTGNEEIFKEINSEYHSLKKKFRV